MIQIVYVSAALEPFSLSALDTLLVKARARNTFHKVTGMLLYHSGSFLQVLEGPVDSVELIFNSIRRDPRHTDTKILNTQTVVRREFADWSMGFLDVSSWPFDTPGKIDYRLALMKLPDAPSAAKRYIQLFHQGLCRQAVTA